MNAENLKLDWEKMDGMIPAIVQHAHDGRVLMVGYMSEASLQRSIEIGKATFFSRSRQQLWTKGETSGHFLELVSLHSDCDGDAIVARALPHGPVCHLMTPTCFADDPGPDVGIVSILQRLISERHEQRPEGSYTTKLFDSGAKRIAQKVGEEGVEAALAGAVGDKEELTNEAADLLYHLMVLLEANETSINDVCEVLRKRFS